MAVFGGGVSTTRRQDNFFAVRMTVGRSPVVARAPGGRLSAQHASSCKRSQVRSITPSTTLPTRAPQAAGWRWWPGPARPETYPSNTVSAIVTSDPTRDDACILVLGMHKESRTGVSLLIGLSCFAIVVMGMLLFVPIWHCPMCDPELKVTTLQGVEVQGMKSERADCSECLKFRRVSLIRRWQIRDYSRRRLQMTFPLFG